MSKYMLLIYSDYKRWADVGEAEQGAIMGEYFAYSEALADAGAMVTGDALQPVDTAKTVAKDGVVTDGPFADIAEHLGGYYVIDVASMEEAIDWAGKIPGVPRGIDRIEVRPLMERPDDSQ